MSSGALYVFGDLEEGCSFAKVFSQENNSKLYSAAPRYAINQTSSLDYDATHVISYLSAFIRRDRHSLTSSLTFVYNIQRQHGLNTTIKLQWMQKEAARSRRSSPKSSIISYRLTISRRIMQQKYVSRGS